MKIQVDTNSVIETLKLAIAELQKLEPDTECDQVALISIEQNATSMQLMLEHMKHLNRLNDRKAA